MDCSGYNNNGVMIGSLTTITDPPRYDTGLYTPSGNTNYITTEDVIGNPSDAITMNIWFKSSCTTPGSNYHEIFGYSTNFEFAIYKSGYLRQGIVVNGTRQIINGPSNSNLLDGKWHMLTATYDGTSVKRYIDGEIVDTMTQSASGPLDGANSQFLIYQRDTKYYSKEASVSDARIYATALSAAAIKELYNTSAAIDSSGNVYAREFINPYLEITQKIYKNGQAIFSDFAENDFEDPDLHTISRITSLDPDIQEIQRHQASITKTGEFYGYNFIEY